MKIKLSDETKIIMGITVVAVIFMGTVVVLDEFSESSEPRTFTYENIDVFVVDIKVSGGGLNYLVSDNGELIGVFGSLNDIVLNRLNHITLRHESWGKVIDSVEIGGVKG